MHHSREVMGCCPPSKCKAVILFVFGVLFFLGTLDVWPEFTFMKYWPLVVVALSLHALVCPCWKKKGMEGGGCACPEGACKCR